MEINRVACVGAGLIGHSWATLFCSNGLEVVLQDISEDVLKKAAKRIESKLNFLEQHDLIKNGGAEAALKKIKTKTSIAEAVNNVDYVQESAPENYNDKKRVFREMDANAPEHAILASSASALLMTEIQKATTRPERCVIAHPIHPLYLIPLVEIVGGEKTSSETIKATYDFMLKMGKTPVVLNKEAFGYIINRLQSAMLREAIDLIDKGVASAEEIDKAFRMGIGLRNPFLGPFLRIYLAGGGIDDDELNFIKKFSQSYSDRWKTMSTWTSIPDPEKFTKSVSKMEIVRTKTLEEIERWRDKMILKLLRILEEDGGRAYHSA